MNQSLVNRRTCCEFMTEDPHDERNCNPENCMKAHILFVMISDMQITTLTSYSLILTNCKWCKINQYINVKAFEDVDFSMKIIFSPKWKKKASNKPSIRKTFYYPPEDGVFVYHWLSTLLNSRQHVYAITSYLVYLITPLVYPRIRVYWTLYFALLTVHLSIRNCSILLYQLKRRIRVLFEKDFFWMTGH